MTRKERILAYMNSEEYTPLTFSELCVVLDVPKEADAEFLEILTELEEDEKIANTKKGRYVALKKDPNKVIGKIRCNGRGFFGFVLPEEEGMDDVFIAGENLGTAYDGDRVLVQIDKKVQGGKCEGHIIKVLERGNTTLTGVVEKEKKNDFRIKCDNERIYSKIRVQPSDMMDAVIGDRVVVEIVKYDNDGHIFGIVKKNLGDSRALKGNVEAIIFEHNITQEFSEDVLTQTEQIPDKVDSADIVGRVDLRDKIIFTIDGDTARDFDDAVSIEKLENGNYYLGVHIADVTHYVKEGSALDKSAFERATSVYLADRVIPMLPKKLSNGICSLNPHVNRLTLSVFMEIDQNGGIINNKMCKSVIRSAERMTYNDVTDLLEGDNEELKHKYEYIMPDLKMMAELAKILRAKRMNRGSIDFNFVESEIEVNEMGEPVAIKKEKREVSHKLIEEFMLAANETVAEYAFWSDIPFVYRIHETPDMDKIDEFNRFIMNFGLQIKGKADEELHPKALQQIIEKVQGTPEEFMISKYLLRSLMKAKYSPNNSGHFGLAAKYYTHFTSPIRRYPDLAIHRILKDFIDGKLNDDKTKKYKKFADDTAVQSTEKQTEADYCERDVEDLMKAAYMSKFIGSDFTGVVSSVTSFGMFVELENSVEGLIRVENMEQDYFEYNEALRQLIGNKTGKVYKVGDEVDVVLIRTDLLSRQIDFMLKEDATKKNIDKARKKSVKKKAEKESNIKKLEKKKGKKSNKYNSKIKKKK